MPPVTMTAEAEGLQPGAVYTGENEAFLVAAGVARPADPNVPGPLNTGPSFVDPDQDIRLAENREDPGETYDVDQGGVDNEAPTLNSLLPDTGPAAGGTEVTLSGDDLTGVTGVTFGGVAATAVELEDDNTVVATTPAGAAGTVDVVITDDVGADTLVGSFTYVA